MGATIRMYVGMSGAKILYLIRSCGLPSSSPSSLANLSQVYQVTAVPHDSRATRTALLRDCALAGFQ